MGDSTEQYLCSLQFVSRNYKSPIFDCRYTSYIWALCKLKLGMSQQISSLTIEPRMLNSTFRTKSQSTALARLVLASAVWHIWKERNLRIFQHKEIKNTQIPAIAKRCFDIATRKQMGGGLWYGKRWNVAELVHSSYRLRCATPSTEAWRALLPA